MAEHAHITRRAAIVGAFTSSAALAVPVAAALPAPNDAGTETLVPLIRAYKRAHSRMIAAYGAVRDADMPVPTGSGPSWARYWNARKREGRAFERMLDAIHDTPF